MRSLLNHLWFPPNLTIDPLLYKSIKNDNLIKIITKKPSDIRDYRDRFTHFESDILYTQKFLIDAQIKSGISYDSSPCTTEDLKPIDFNTPARVCILILNVVMKWDFQIL